MTRYFNLFFATLKFSKILPILKVLKFTKPLMTAATLSLSLFMYGVAYGWLFGLALIGVLMIHEMGHIVALRRLGMTVPGPVFIPFLGAAIFVPPIENRTDEAYMAMGGPLFGAASVVIALGGYWVTKHPLFMIAAHLAVILNLFNLLPISPLDGGRVTQVMGPKFKYIGAIALLFLSLLIMNPAILLVWILVLDSFKLWRYGKCELGAVCGIIMVILMVAGYSTQHWAIDLIDSLFASFIVFTYWLSDHYAWKQREDVRSYPSADVKTKWFGLWLGTIVVLLALGFYTAMVIPK